MWIVSELINVDDDERMVNKYTTLFATDSEYSAYDLLWCYLYQSFQTCYREIPGFMKYYEYNWDRLNEIDDFLLEYDLNQEMLDDGAAPLQISFKFHLNGVKVDMFYCVREIPFVPEEKNGRRDKV